MEEKKKAEMAGMVSYVLPEEQKEWGDKIIFFEERIIENQVVTKFHTDEFTLQQCC